MPRDRGAATIYALAVGLVLVLAGLGVAMRASDVVAAAQARSAADLGALAGAQWVAIGTACPHATDIVLANGASVVSCQVIGLDLMVTVDVRGQRATARAGPIRSNATWTRAWLLG
jgi:secretion/DNA translocation related TadE-like protein